MSSKDKVGDDTKTHSAINNRADNVGMGQIVLLGAILHRTQISDFFILLIFTSFTWTLSYSFDFAMQLT